jgi:hypothetical protein
VELAGCISTDKIVLKRDLSIEEVLQRVRERNQIIKTLKGDGTITVESPEESNSGSFDVMLKKPDSLRVEFSGPFGIHVGTLMLSRDKFLFYNSMENKVITGTPDGNTLQSMFRLKMNFEEVVRAFTGEFPMEVSNDSLIRFVVKDDQYVMTFHKDRSTVECYIDGDTFVVTAYRVLDIEGTAILTALASRFESTGDITMPTLLRVIFPKERRSVTIAYSDVQINEPVECSFIPPPQAHIPNQ